MTTIQKISWNDIKKEKLSATLSRQVVFGEKGTMALLSARSGNMATRHSHPSEEYVSVATGSLKFTFEDREVVVNAGEFLLIPPNVPHAVTALEDAVFMDFFAPGREDWKRGEDQYLRL